MQTKQKVERVNFKLARGIRWNGQRIDAFQTKKTGKGPDVKIEKGPARIINLTKTFALQLQGSAKGKITEEKGNFKLPERVVPDELAEAFGEENEPEKGKGEQ